MAYGKVFLFIGFILLGLTFSQCKKSNPDSSNLYIPTANDATANASLDELKQGRVLYINNCGECHNYVSPEQYSPSGWRNELKKMAPKTNMTAAEIDLVTKYVCKGNQK